MLQLCLLLLLGIQQILASQNPYHQSYQPPSPPPPQHSSSNQGEGVGERQTSDSFKEEQQPIQYASHQNAPQREGGDTHVPRGDVYPPHRPFVSGADPNSNPRYPPHPQQHPQQHPHAPPGSMGGIRPGPGEVPGSARGFGEGALTPYGKWLDSIHTFHPIPHHIVPYLPPTLPRFSSSPKTAASTG